MPDLSMERELLDIASAAETVLLAHWRNLKAGEVAVKGGRLRDLVTVADREAEAVIIERLAAAFPGVGVLGEESGAVGGVGGDRFIVDPLDGTTNYMQGLQHFGVSIGFEHAGVIECGVVGVPVLNERFSATRGRGSRRNGEPIAVSERSVAAELFVASGFACVRAGYGDNSLRNWSELHMKIRELRRLGAATIDLCYTACGIFDAFFELALQPWDVAAGSLIVEEAGGRVTDLDGGGLWKDGASVLASNRRCHEYLMNALPVHWAR